MNNYIDDTLGAAHTQAQLLSMFMCSVISLLKARPQHRHDALMRQLQLWLNWSLLCLQGIRLTCPAILRTNHDYGKATQLCTCHCAMLDAVEPSQGSSRREDTHVCAAASLPGVEVRFKRQRCQAIQAILIYDSAN